MSNILDKGNRKIKLKNYADTVHKHFYNEQLCFVILEQFITCYTLVYQIRYLTLTNIIQMQSFSGLLSK
jgi:hypothetical protein